MASLWDLDGVRLGPLARPRFACASLAIEPGVTAILGESGAGKTSLLNLLVGFERPDAGRITGPPKVSQGHLPLYWVPQDGGLWPHLDAAQHLSAVAIEESPGDWLSRFGLADAAGQRPPSLSVGQRARLAVARALAAHAAVLVMDEPLAHVDGARSPAYWQTVIDNVRERDASLVFATHEPDRILGSADRVVLVADGELRHESDAATLYRRPPNRELALALGPVNWWTPEVARALLGSVASDGDTCLRPHALELVADPEGALTVSGLQDRGAIAAVRVMDASAASHDLLCTMHDPVEVGARVRLLVRGAS